MKKLLIGLAPALALVLPPLASAADPKPGGAPLPYTSAFVDYKTWQDIKPGDWRRLNEGLASGAGGHAGHTMGGMAPPAAAAPAAKASAPAPGAHKGHQMHQMPGGKP